MFLIVVTHLFEQHFETFLQLAEHGQTATFQNLKSGDENLRGVRFDGLEFRVHGDQDLGCVGVTEMEAVVATSHVADLLIQPLNLESTILQALLHLLLE